MNDDMTRLDALRALLAAHEPTEDDQRVGHTYRWPLPAMSVRMVKRTRKAKQLAAKVMTLAGWRVA